MWPIDRPLNDLRASCQQQIVSDISAAATRQALGTVFVLLTCSPISLQNYQLMWRVTEVSNQFLHPAFTPTIDFLDKSLVSEIVYIQISFHSLDRRSGRPKQRHPFVQRHREQ